MKRIFTFFLCLGTLILTICVPIFSATLQIDGYVLLDRSDNHSNIEILFERIEPSKQNYKTFSNIDGYYKIEVEEGIYNIQYKKSNHETISINNQLFFSDKTLDSVSLKFIGLSGTISGRLTKGIYNVVGKLSLNTGDTLIIDPGVVLKFKENVSFDVYGTIIARGTEEDSIYFTRYDDSTAWGGLNLNNQTRESIFSYSVIEHCKKFGMSLCSSQVSLENLQIRYNSVKNSELGTSALFLNASSPLIKNCVISNNNIDGYKYEKSLGGGVYMCQSSNAIFENTIITNNSANHGGGVYIFDSHPIFRNVLIYGNKANIGGGVSLFQVNYTLENVTIVNNTAEFGAGICSGGDLNKVNNCIIAFNNGWGVEGSAVKNSCVFGNIPDNFRHCNKWCGVNVKTNQNGDSIDVFGNMVKDPIFIDYLNNNFNLQAQSPCIDAGLNDIVKTNDDFNGNIRIWDGNDDGDTIVDLGAIEYNSEPFKMMVNIEENGFEDGLGNWNILGLNQFFNWNIVTTTEDVYNGLKSLKITNNDNQNSIYLISPIIDIPKDSSTFIYFFAKKEKAYSSQLAQKKELTQIDKSICKIMISETGPELSNFAYIKNYDYEIYDSWSKFNCNLSKFQGKSINIAFELNIPDTNSVFLDNISVKSTNVNPNSINNNIKEDNELFLYPNPTNEYLTMTRIPTNCYLAMIFDESGKEVRSIDIKNQSENLKISTKDLPVGAYILRIFVGGEVLDRKFVVVR